MSNQAIKPIAAAVGAAFLSSALVPAAAAASNPFEANELNAGYNIADGAGHKEGGCGEGKCGGEKGDHKDKEGKCGEGKCGGDAKGKEGKGKEGKCGEGKCGGDAKGKEGKCGEGKCGGDAKKGAEGKCGEGKCGG